MPTLNEAAYVQDALASLTQSPLPFPHEILVVDGGSGDGTCDLVQDCARRNPAIKLHHNPQGHQAAGINLAVRRWIDPACTILLRADCHARYPDNFAAQAVAALRRTRAVSVVVPVLAQGRTPTQRAIAAVLASPLGHGGAAHRRLGPSHFVDHGHHAAFDRAAFQAAGGYDDAFRHNEDAELDLRLRQAGGQIWLETAIPVTTFPRPNLAALARQYFRYGWGRAQTVAKHRTRPQFRQAAPVALVLINGLCLLLSALGYGWFAGGPLTYGAVVLLWCARLAPHLCLRATAAAMIMHHGWGAGFLARLCAAATT